MWLVENSNRILSMFYQQDQWECLKTENIFHLVQQVNSSHWSNQGPLFGSLRVLHLHTMNRRKELIWPSKEITKVCLRAPVNSLINMLYLICCEQTVSWPGATLSRLVARKPHRLWQNSRCSLTVSLLFLAWGQTEHTASSFPFNEPKEERGDT